ncbi:Hypothetical_protein [Hexamita inflata]|uniref:Hypothetical_protein n=1 Tax=Hexamita inflata TaxID=28002 RepID=A0AA86TXM4_9EUKA|nr:Hypothetical protein HINF_LOCUS20985 [Hexamita inflata]
MHVILTKILKIPAEMRMYIAHVPSIQFSMVTPSPSDPALPWASPFCLAPTPSRPGGARCGIILLQFQYLLGVVVYSFLIVEHMNLQVLKCSLNFNIAQLNNMTHSTATIQQYIIWEALKLTQSFHDVLIFQRTIQNRMLMCSITPIIIQIFINYI